MLLLVGNYVKLLVGFSAPCGFWTLVRTQVTVKPQLVQRLLFRSFVQLFAQHVLKLVGMESELLLFAFQLLSDARDHCLLEKDFGSGRLFVFYYFGNMVVPQTHGPNEVAFSDVALAEEMAKLSDIALHKTFGAFLVLLLQL